MAVNDHTQLPAGVEIVRECDTCVDYVGTEDALVAAGLIQPAWAQGLSHHSRQIVLSPDGGFTVVAEGKGNHITHAHRNLGAYRIKRLQDGRLRVGKCRTVAEQNAYDEERRKRLEREQAKNAWGMAAEARLNADYPARWKSGVLRHVQQISEFLDGKLVFEGFPDIRLDSNSISVAKEMVGVLERQIKALSPRVDDTRVEAGNVVFLREQAYWRMATAKRNAAAR